MNSTLFFNIAELIAGLLINIFIGPLAVALFRKDGTASRLPLRILGVYLVINSVPGIFHI
ncbi:threonine/homoserine efflux transporter RhtA [Paenibacillus forsythiae]|uniref:Threonine/homoserine efflux transporter RhtA n=1 Tax=Paenibacillus forsythiae TaxID=365616 RepID=A0ABU3H645_9BACL|nr:hypothetical protein [Paenibacillus forsythiae]MDT3426186.1 threonine/homoserine efflux transporter RhtA [Paenibacillus forsythiae]